MRADDRRPLLGLRRTETEGVCAAFELDVVRDPSNADPRFRRNRVRHELLRQMGAVAERDVVPVLARQAELFAAEADLMECHGTSTVVGDKVEVECLSEVIGPDRRGALGPHLCAASGNAAGSKHRMGCATDTALDHARGRDKRSQ